MTVLRGKVSWFGGPDDEGVSPSEGLAFIYSVDMAPDLFLDYQPSGTTGLARRLDPDEFYIACRWDYDAPGLSKEDLLDVRVLVRNVATGKALVARPSDWGPHDDTDRVADISPGLMDALDLTTDDEVEVTFPYQTGQPEKPVMATYSKIVISSGHGKKVRGASGILDEVDEARKVVEALADELKLRKIDVVTYHDDVSTTQNENLNRIVDFHNSKTRDLDISVHFNAYEQVEKPMGTEVLYVTQQELAAKVSAAIADAGGFIDRGAKYRSDLFVLNNTEEPAILIEVCFVDSTADAELYEGNFDAICDAIADVLGGDDEEAATPPPDRPKPVGGRVDIEVSGNVALYVNGQKIV